MTIDGDIRAQGLRLDYYTGAAGRNMGSRSRFRRVAEMDSLRRREPDWAEQTFRRGGMYPQFPAEGWRPYPRATRRALGLRNVVRIYNPRKSDGSRELPCDLSPVSGDGRRSH